MITRGVLDKFSLKTGNIGVIIEDDSGNRCSVEFTTGDKTPWVENLYGYIHKALKAKDSCHTKLMKSGNCIDSHIQSFKKPT